MFETETMAELCLKQGLLRDALMIYRRLLASAPDAETRARRAQRIAELEQRDGDAQTASVRPAPPAPTAIQARHDHQQVTLEWRLPAGTTAPALEILVLRRQKGDGDGDGGITVERRTVRLPDAQGTLTLPIAGVHSLRAAAGKLDGDRFVPLVRLDAQPDPETAPPVGPRDA